MSYSEFLKQTYVFFRNFFWYSEKKYKARLFFLAILLLTVATVIVTAYFAAWNALFWTALSSMNSVVFLQQMLMFVPLVTVDLTVHMLKKFLKESLIVEWRDWLTRKLLNSYIDPSHQNYLKLVREYKHIDNPEQRIQEDVDKFVGHAIHHLFDFIKSTMNFVTFIGALWVIGGSLSVSLLGLSFVIPGYLVWVALSFSLVASFITHKLGNRLTQINQKAEVKEAKFRQSVRESQQFAENIGLEKAELFYRQRQESRLKKIVHLAYKKIQLYTKLIGFRELYMVVADFFPYLVSAPIYFSGVISLGQMMQIGFYFSQINNALNWFIDSYETIASFKASSERIVKLQSSFIPQKLPVTIQRRRSYSSTEILLEHLDIQQPQEQKTILKDLNLRFKPGQHTLIQGPSGTGKSTLFKAISGTWSYGQGLIKLPKDDVIMCLPQFITIPENMTLREILAYPSSVDSISAADVDELCEQIPILVAKKHLLDTKKMTWSQTLSGGEKQQLAFARALLQKPQWLLLDETTASLDLKTEALMYHLLKTKLPSTTILSISHKENLQDLHTQTLKIA